jgi:hypothetical protein
MFASTGQNPFGGLLDTLRGTITSDQLNTLLAIVNAGAGQAGYPTNDAEMVMGLYNNLMGGGGMPTLGQVFGNVFGQSTSDPNNPFLGLLTGGTPQQQAGMMGGAVMDMAGAMGLNPLNTRALGYQLDRLMSAYQGSQGMEGANMTFIDYLKRNAPNLVGMITGA